MVRAPPPSLSRWSASPQARRYAHQAAPSEPHAPPRWLSSSPSRPPSICARDHPFYPAQPPRRRHPQPPKPPAPKPPAGACPLSHPLLSSLQDCVPSPGPHADSVIPHPSRASAAWSSCARLVLCGPDRRPFSRGRGLLATLLWDPALSSPPELASWLMYLYWSCSEAPARKRQHQVRSCSAISAVVEHARQGAAVPAASPSDRLSPLLAERYLQQDCLVVDQPVMNSTVRPALPLLWLRCSAWT